MNLKRCKTSLAFAALLALGLSSTALMADTVTFTQGNHPQPTEQNVLFDNGMGSTVTGHTNQSNTLVDFSSSTDILIASGGQCCLTAQDGLINDVTISVPGDTFTDLIFNPFKPQNNNDILVTVLLTDATTQTFMYGDIHGNNFLTIVDANGPGIVSVTFDSMSGFETGKQPRISGLGSNPPLVPEPGSMFLLGSGLLGGVGLLRKRFSSR